MRIVAGRWRGRVLKSPRGRDVRPTTDRVKEALFSILGGDALAGAVFVDLCCGAGGLAAEALSRGAGRVILVDRDRASLEIAGANLELCGATPGTYDLVRRDCLSWLDDWTPPAGPWLLVADPPYRTPLPWAILEKVVELAAADGFRAAVVEHSSREEPVATGVDRTALRLETRHYGQSGLTILRPGPEQ